MAVCKPLIIDFFLTGHITVFNIGVENRVLSLKVAYRVEIHKPQLVDGKPRIMEIWSLSWSPDDAKIATASEDQTCMVSCSKTGLFQFSYVVRGQECFWWSTIYF